MRRCLELAESGMGAVSPNPMVGCVILKNGLVIGEGYHKQYGGPHAEVNALRSVENQDEIAGSTVYVSLEPCSHFGKTPPCAQALIDHKVGKVVIACEDPFAKVHGKGIKMLQNAGIAVEVGVLESESIRLNRRFMTYHTQQRPFIILKWAQSPDGFMAPEKSEGIHWISNDLTKQFSHTLRRNEDAILVGKNTIIQDNPSLTTRLVDGPDPVRIVLDSRLESYQTGRTVYTKGKTLVFNTQRSGVEGETEFIQCEMQLTTVMKHLHALSIMSVIIEGGKQVLDSFIQSGLWDEAYVVVGSEDLKAGLQAPVLDLPYTEEIKGNNTIRFYQHD